MAEEDTPKVPGPNYRPLVLPDRFSGKEEWNQWISHFDNVAAVNTWNEAQKLLWLNVRLTERARRHSSTSLTMFRRTTRLPRRRSKSASSLSLGRIGTRQNSAVGGERRQKVGMIFQRT